LHFDETDWSYRRDALEYENWAGQHRRVLDSGTLNLSKEPLDESSPAGQLLLQVHVNDNQGKTGSKPDPATAPMI